MEETVGDEVWRDVPGHPGMRASSFGRIKGVRGQVAPGTDHQGYRAHKFKGRRVRAHRLVALAFLPNPEGLPQVDHRNGDRADNRPHNLRWVTNQENTSKGLGRGRVIVDPQGTPHLTMNLEGFCREHDLNAGNVYSMLSGRFAQTKGWTAPVAR